MGKRVYAVLAPERTFDDCWVQAVHGGPIDDSPASLQIAQGILIRCKDAYAQEKANGIFPPAFNGKTIVPIIVLMERVSE